PMFAAPTNAISFGGQLAVAQLAAGNVIRASDGTPYISGLAAPSGLAGTSSGDLYVADWATGNLWQAVSAVAILSSPVLIAQNLVLPEGIAIDANGDILVVEGGANRLSRVNVGTGVVNPISSYIVIGIT